MSNYLSNYLLKSKQLLLLAGFLIACIQSQGQVTFSDGKSMLTDVYTQISTISEDMNNDQQDDLVFFDNGNKIVVQLNNGLQRDWYRIEGPVVGEAWAGLAADFDRDGRMEIVVGSIGQKMRIYTFDDKAESFTLYYEAPTSFFIQNMSVGDIDQDGWQDLFVCDDHGTNFTYKNDGEGGFSPEEMIDFNTVPSSDNSGNYGSVFVDFDWDGDLDLFISKCSAFAEDSTDPRRINQLFVNDGDGNYEDLAQQYGLASGAQTWATDFADFDNDGDLDALVLNHFEDLQFMENIDNDTFVEIQADSGLELQNSFWQINLYDMDNDGYEDVIIDANNLHYYHNNGDMSFSKVDIDNQGELAPVFTTVVGDYNNDGFLDLCNGYGSLNLSSNVADKIFLNDANSNSWLTVILENEDEHSEAIGARLELSLADGTSQIRQIKAGHSYGIMNSKKAHFGLGSSSVNVLKVLWADGEESTYEDIESNQLLFVKKNSCTVTIQSAELIEDGQCEGEFIELEFNGDSFNQWNLGALENTFIYNGDDQIYAEYGSNACQFNSWIVYPFYIANDEITNEIDVMTDGVLPCSGEVVEIIVNGKDILWDNNSTEPVFESSVPGAVSVEYESDCILYSTTFNRKDKQSNFVIPPAIIQYDMGTDVEISVNQETAEWFNEPGDIVPFHIGEKFLFENVVADRKLYIEDHDENTYKSVVGFQEETNGTYPSGGANPVVVFAVHSNVILESIDVYAMIEAERRIVIKDQQGQEVFAKNFLVEEGKTVLELNVDLAEGLYDISTDSEVNLANIGSVGPLLIREMKGSDIYPLFDDQGFISIIGNTYGSSIAYYSFYNWKVKKPDKFCEAGPFEVELKNMVSTNDYEINNFRYNNPATNTLNINSEKSGLIEIHDLIGQRIYQSDLKSNLEINISSWQAGQYIIRFNNQSYPLIKQ